MSFVGLNNIYLVRFVDVKETSWMLAHLRGLLDSTCLEVQMLQETF